MPHTVSEIRKQIDEVDRRILALLNQRAELAGELVSAKRAEGVPICDPQRELEVLQKATVNRGALAPEAVMRIYRQIICECRGVQKSLASSGAGAV